MSVIEGAGVPPPIGKQPLPEGFTIPQYTGAERKMAQALGFLDPNGIAERPLVDVVRDRIRFLLSPDSLARQPHLRLVSLPNGTGSALIDIEKMEVLASQRTITERFTGRETTRYTLKQIVPREPSLPGHHPYYTADATLIDARGKSSLDVVTYNDHPIPKPITDNATIAQQLWGTTFETDTDSLMAGVDDIISNYFGSAETNFNAIRVILPADKGSVLLYINPKSSTIPEARDNIDVRGVDIVGPDGTRRRRIITPYYRRPDSRTEPIGTMTTTIIKDDTGEITGMGAESTLAGSGRGSKHNISARTLAPAR